jgi:hypothetical protein
MQPPQTKDVDVQINNSFAKPWTDSKGNSPAHKINVENQGNYLAN